MKRYIKLLLLTVFAFSALGLMVAQTYSGPDPAYKQVYQNPKVKEAVEFMKNELPTLVRTNPEQAATEYEKHFSSLNQLEEMDVLYLVGHFYAVSNDAQTALRYFPLLASHPQLGEDARRMINLLLYQRAISNLLSTDKEAAKVFIEDVMNVFDTGKYYPAYLYIWADLVSSSERSTEVATYINNYQANRNWVETQFKPRKSAIIDRLEALNTDDFYQNPTTEKYQALAQSVDGIKADLETLYAEARTIKGLVLMEAMEQVRKEEARILDDYKKSLRFYLDTPEVSVNAMLDPNSPLQENPYFQQFYEGAYYIAQMRIYQDLLGKTISHMDRVFEIKYQMFVNEDPNILGKDFSDMELKRLLDIEKNLKLYSNLITEIEAVMATPEYKAQTAMDFSGQLKDYKEKRQDLQIRKDRYLATRKHESDFEEQLFNEFLNEYYALNAEFDDWKLTLDMAEEDLVASIMMIYPEQMKLMAQGHRDNIQSQQDFGKLDQQLGMIAANLDFISLQNRYRNLNYRDARRKADTSLSLAETTRQYEEIVAQKQVLLSDYATFLQNNPDFKAMETPVLDAIAVDPDLQYQQYQRYGYLISQADVYYNMAELQWATDLDNMGKALANYRKVLEIDPDFYLKDHTLYNIAYFSSEINREAKDRLIDDWRTLNPNRQRGTAQRITEEDFAEAIANYSTIINDFPSSVLYDEAAYRLANLYFLIGTDAERPIEWYAKANTLYDKLVAKEGSPYRFEAMFQRGFVNMNISDEASLTAALVDFANILNAVDNNLIIPAETAQDLKNNSLDQIAYCLVAMDGSDFSGQSRGLEAMARVLADYKDEVALARILDKASANKKDMRLTRQSIDFLDLRLQKTPNALINPSLVDSVLVLFYANDISLRPGEDRDQIRRERYRFMVENYGKDSRWYEVNVKGKDLSDPALAKQLASIRNAYRQAQIVRYETVRTQLTEETYQAYLDHTQRFAAYEELFQPAVYSAYVEHLKTFKATPAAFDADYAQWLRNSEKEGVILLGNLADKRQTDEAYMMVYNRLLSYNEKYLVPADAEYFDNEELAYSYALRRDQLLKPQLQGADADSLYVFYKDATLRFVGALMNSGTEARIRQARQLTLDLAHTEFNDARYREAEARYLSILANDPTLNNNSKYDIYYNLSFIAESDQSIPPYDRFKKAEDYARQAMAFTADGTKIANADRQIKLQIQNSFNAARESNDNAAAALNYGRMAVEFPFERFPAEHINYKRLEAEQYQLAKQYDKLIDTYMYLASKESATNVEAIYNLYYLSWNAADSLMQDPNRAAAIRNEFMAQYPGSNQTYRLRALVIERKAADPATKLAAAEDYIALSEEVRAGQIDAGDVKPENIYMQAYNIYNEDQKSTKRLEVLDEFIRRYPNHPDVTGMLRTIASGYFVLGDTLRFEDYAKRLFARDKKEFDLYQGVAVKYLSRVLVEYDNAYLNKEWTLAFKKRDEFKALEAQYRKEGLPLDTTEQYKSFAAAEAEYKDLQAQLAFLKTFDTQITALERSEFLRKTPNQQFAVGAKTSFKSSLLGGKLKLLPNFKYAINAEVNKVEKLITPANQLKLDTPRIVRALALEARIYEYGIEVVTAQINRFFEVANEIRPYRDDPAVQANIWGQINNDYIYPFEDAANAIYASVFSTFHLAGFEDQNTRQAVAKLTERNILPDYQKLEYPLGTGWTMKWINDAGTETAANPIVGNVTTPRGQILGNLQIPPVTKLQAEFKLNSAVAPDLVFLQMVYPYNPEAYVNGKQVQFVGFAVDSLDVKQPMTARFGYRLSGAEWDAKENTVRLLFPNRYQENIPVRATLQAYFDKAKLEQAKPRETVSFVSGTSWRVMVMNPETQEENAIPSRIAEGFAIPAEAIEGLKDTMAQPVWVIESVEEPVNNVTFEADFNLDGKAISAVMEFIAPDNASIFLNGNLVAADQMLDAEMNPLKVYTTVVDLPVDALRQGRNTIRVQVQNQTAYRGMLAEIKIEKYVKE